MLENLIEKKYSHLDTLETSNSHRTMLCFYYSIDMANFKEFHYT